MSEKHNHLNKWSWMQLIKSKSRLKEVKTHQMYQWEIKVEQMIKKTIGVAEATNKKVSI